MWKIIIGFIIFAALSLFVILQGGDKIDMGGEKHGGDSHAPETAPAAAAAPAAPVAPVTPATPAEGASTAK